MNAYKIKTVLQQDGTLILHGLPFRDGEAVEIIILENFQAKKQDLMQQPKSTQAPLRGALLRYDEPFEPAVPLEDWEAFQ